MNAMPFSRSTGERDAVWREVLTGKLKSNSSPWLTGLGTAHLCQVHLHIDAPTLVMKQKSAEQQRSDENRQRDINSPEDGKMLLKPLISASTRTLT